MDEAVRAAAEAARRRVKRAQGLLREAAHDLAALADGPTVLGVHRVHDAASANAARESIVTCAAQCGAVDVVVIARPGARATQPTTAAIAAKEK